jgi:biopolymer transport protein ExbB/TolQ
MSETGYSMFMLLSFNVISCLIVLLTCLKVFKFFREFESFKSRNDAELNTSVWHLKHVSELGVELLQEMKRTNRLLYELAERKKDVESEDGDIDYSQEDILRHHKEPQAPRESQSEAQIMEETHRSRIERFKNIGKLKTL